MGELMAKHMWNERSQEVAADARKYVKQIATRYKSAYTYCILQQMRKNLSAKNDQSLLLEQRKWHTYNRPLQNGYLYVLGGSEHRKWRRRFCVLQPDYTLEVYDSEEDFEVANHPRYRQKFSNYKVIDNVDAHFAELVKDYLRDFGYVRENVSHIIKKLGSPSDPSKRPTQHVLALYHRYKGRFYMAADSAVQKDKWMKSMQDAERQLSGVHCETQVQRDAFEFAIKQSCDAEEHCGISVNMSGTQEEITTEFIADYLSNGCKTMLQTKVSGDACKKFKMWEAISKTLTISVENVVKVEYPLLRKQAEEEAEQLKQKMLLSMPQINAVYETASVEILAVLDCNFKEELIHKILPKIPELVSRMGELLSLPLREARDVFISLAESVLRQSTTTSTEFANNIDRFFLDQLDLAPRNPEMMHDTFQSAIGKKSPFSVLSETFPKLNYSHQETKLCLLLQTVLDSAICTFEGLCGEAVQKNKGHLQPANITKIQGRVLKKLDHDSILLTKKFLKELALKITYDMLQHIIRYDARNKLRDHEDLIPTELREFLPIANVFRDAVWETIEEELQPSISVAFKRLAKDHFRISRYHSSSTINSHSSNASEDTNTTPKHESLSKQTSSSDSSPIQVSVPVVEEIQVSESSHGITTDEESAVNEDICCTGLPACKDGETGERCAVDEYGELLLPPTKENDCAIPQCEQELDPNTENVENENKNSESGDTCPEIYEADTEHQNIEKAVVDQQEVEENISLNAEQSNNCVMNDAVNSDEETKDLEKIEADKTDVKMESIEVGVASISNEGTKKEQTHDEIKVEEIEFIITEEDDTSNADDNETDVGCNPEKIEVKNTDEEVKTRNSEEDVIPVVEDLQKEDENQEQSSENIEEMQNKTQDENGDSLPENKNHDEQAQDKSSTDDKIHDDYAQTKEVQNSDYDNSYNENPSEDLFSHETHSEKETQLDTSDEKQDYDSSLRSEGSLNDVSDSQKDAKPDENDKEKERSADDHCVNSEGDSVIETASERDEQHEKKESDFHKTNGKINQNGVSKLSYDNDAPSVPARHKKHSTDDKKEESRNIAEHDNEVPVCVIDDEIDIEYNGVIEQIIHTGEEKLI